MRFWPFEIKRLLLNRRFSLWIECAVVAALSPIIASPPGTVVAQQKGKPDTAAASSPAEKAKAGANSGKKGGGKKSDAGDAADDDRPKKVVKSDSEWMKVLSKEQFRVTRKKATERPFMGKLWNNKKDGVYVCVCCGQPLFDSKAKFDAKNGYPCFNAVMDSKSITIASDKKRIECSRCDANLGQVITNGGQPGGAPLAGAPPQPPPGAAQPPAGAQLPGIGPPPAAAQPAAQQRYCLNNQSIKFVPRADFEKTYKSK